MTRSTIARRLMPVLALLACAASLFPLISEAKTTKVAGAPAASTGAVTHVRGFSAELEGTVIPGTQTASYYFEYGPTTAYGSQTTPASLPPGTTAVKVGQQVIKLLPGYHYRLVATSLVGPSDGKDRIFTAKSVKSAITVVKPTTASVFGSAITITGTVSGPGNASRKLVLQASPYPYLEAFAAVGAPITTNTFGAFVFHVPALSSSTQFRVATLDPRPAYSPAITEQVAVRVTLKVRTSAHKGLVRLYGTVSPASVGARVFFQLRKAVRPGGKSEQTTRFSSQFSTVVKRASKTTSRFSAVVEVHRGGRYRAYVDLKKAGALASGASATVVLAAAPTKKKH